MRSGWSAARCAGRLNTPTLGLGPCAAKLRVNCEFRIVAPQTRSCGAYNFHLQAQWPTIDAPVPQCASVRAMRDVNESAA
eukprot:7580664-Alexandrium_andersonii.AAC.1